MIQVTLLRSVILRFVGLLVFFFTTVGLKDQFQCWENYVGQQMYALAFLPHDSAPPHLTHCV